jgi:hypothetical protein
MKKILLILGLLIFGAVLAFSQVVHYTELPNGFEIMWDAPDNVLDGTVPASQITYELYVAPVSITELQDVTLYTLVAVVANPPVVIDWDMLGVTEGAYNFGVLSVRTIPDVADGIFYSDLHWSHVGGVPSPFDVYYFTRPGEIQNLRVQ